MMKVKIYADPELAELFENDEQKERWSELIDDMGIKVQEKVKVNPYEKMEGGLLNLCSDFFNHQTKFDQFNDSTIPLEVLETIKKVQDENLFNELQIWWRGEDKDPILVGVKDGHNSWQKDRWLIARWGDALLPFSELAKKIINFKIKTELVALKKRHIDQQYEIDNFEELLESRYVAGDGGTEFPF